MTDAPADPFRSGDQLADAVQEGSTILDALAATHDDGGRGLLPALSVLDPDDLRAAVFVAVLERWRTETRQRPVLRFRRWLRRRLGPALSRPERDT